MPISADLLFEKLSALAPSALEEAELDFLSDLGFHLQHPKTDGVFFLRLYPQNGEISARQAATLAALADEFGTGLCDLTGRCALQIYHLPPQRIAEFSSRLHTGEIPDSWRKDAGENSLTTCPLAGQIPGEIWNVTPTLHEINQKLKDLQAAGQAPKKFKISVSACPVDCTQSAIHCVSFFAQKDSRGLPGFGVKIGGGLSSSPRFAETLPAWIPPEDAWPVLEALIALYRQETGGPGKKRFKQVVGDWGIPAVLDFVEKRINRPLLPPPPEKTSPETPEKTGNHSGILPSKISGETIVGIPLPAGRLHPGKLAFFARLAETVSPSARLRITQRQHLLFLGIPEAAAPSLLEAAEAFGCSCDSDRLETNSAACAGAEFCSRGLADTKNRMLEIVRSLDASDAARTSGLRIHFSGCPSGCGKHQIADIGLRGTRRQTENGQAEAYDLFVGGRLGEKPVLSRLLLQRVPPENLLPAIQSLLRFFDSTKYPDESFSDFCARKDLAALSAALPPM